MQSICCEGLPNQAEGRQARHSALPPPICPSLLPLPIPHHLSLLLSIHLLFPQASIHPSNHPSLLSSIYFLSVHTFNCPSIICHSSITPPTHLSLIHIIHPSFPSIHFAFIYHLSICLSPTHPSIHHSFLLPTMHSSIHLPFCPSIYHPSIQPSIFYHSFLLSTLHSSIHLSFCPSIYRPSIQPSIHHSFLLPTSIHPSVCPSIHPSIHHFSPPIPLHPSLLPCTHLSLHYPAFL